MTTNNFYKKIQAHLERGFPLVVYSPPGVNSVITLLQNTKKKYRSEDFGESGFVFAPFDPQREALIIPVDGSEFVEIETGVGKTSTTSSPTPTSGDAGRWNEENKKQHLELVRSGIKAIRAGKLEKVVLSRREKLEVMNISPLNAFQNLLDLYPDAFTYLWHHPNTGIWLGASPETLMEVTGDLLQTMSLAGTRSYSADKEVQWGEKEKKEQQYVTDFIVSQLESAVERIFLSETTTQRAGNLLHLKTEIRAELKKEADSLKSIIRALHPTPAVCGLPREKALKFILANEPHDREFYTGFAGELNYEDEPGVSSRLFVNLRCMKIIPEGTAFVYVGGGITADSDPGAEWLETVAKAKTVKNSLVLS